MPDNMLTKCPHCGTTFRLTVAQLKVAGGAVRCGACYHVFHAAGHIVNATDTGHRSTPPKDVFADNITQAPSSFDSRIPKLGDNEPAPTPEVKTVAPKPKIKNNDDTWAEAMLRELGEDIDDDEPASPSNKISSENVFSLEDDTPAPKTKLREKSAFQDTELSDTFVNLGNFSSDDPFAALDLEAEDAADDDVKDDESWAKAILNELEQEETPQKKDEGFSLLMDEDHAENSNSPYAKRARKERDSDAFRTFQQAKEQKQAKQRNSIKHVNPLRNDETEEFFRQFEETPEPIKTKQPTPQRKQEPIKPLEDLDNEDFISEDFTNTGALFADTDDVRKRQYRIQARKAAQEQIQVERNYSLWFGVGCFLLILTLSAQYTFFHFESVARNSTFRPYLEAICGPLNCTLPHQVDTSKVVSSNLVVRSHPREQNALIIDAIIKNLAGFIQPFPDIKLSFQDMNGRVVSSRRFKPTEYIQDKRIDINAMPNNTPIHLNLEIVDPGSKAVNYQLNFLPQS